MTRSLVAVLVFIGACASPTGPELEQFEFFRDQWPEPAVQVENGGVVVEGGFRAPCSPYEVRGEIAVREREMTLVVIGEDADANCPLDAIAHLGYRARIEAAAAGQWTVRVIHRWADADWPEEVVLQQVVDV